MVNIINITSFTRLYYTSQVVFGRISERINGITQWIRGFTLQKIDVFLKWWPFEDLMIYHSRLRLRFESLAYKTIQPTGPNTQLRKSVQIREKNPNPPSIVWINTIRPSERVWINSNSTEKDQIPTGPKPINTPIPTGQHLLFWSFFQTEAALW